MPRAKAAKGDDDDANVSKPDRLTGVGVEVEEAPKAAASPGGEVAGRAVKTDGDGLLENTFWPLTEANGEAVDAYAMNPL